MIFLNFVADIIFALGIAALLVVIMHKIFDYEGSLFEYIVITLLILLLME